jgi:hypothetical protein
LQEVRLIQRQLNVVRHCRLHVPSQIYMPE